jgi:SAM-dependent methyltransferase
MLAEARRLNPAIEFHQSLAESLPFEDGSFDAVCISSGMNHFAEPNRAAAEAFRVMAPGGRFAYTVWSPRSTFGDIATAAVQEHGSLDVALPAGPLVTALAEHDASERLLADAGFVEIEIEEITRDMVLKNAEQALDILDSVTRTRALVEAQTPEAQALIRRALVEGARKFERDGKVRLPMTGVLVSTTRPTA